MIEYTRISVGLPKQPSAWLWSHIPVIDYHFSGYSLYASHTIYHKHWKYGHRSSLLPVFTLCAVLICWHYDRDVIFIVIGGYFGNNQSQRMSHAAPVALVIVALYGMWVDDLHVSVFQWINSIKHGKKFKNLAFKASSKDFVNVELMNLPRNYTTFWAMTVISFNLLGKLLLNFNRTRLYVLYWKFHIASFIIRLTLMISQLSQLIFTDDRSWKSNRFPTLLNAMKHH